jgi:hypothetical protein
MQSQQRMLILHQFAFAPSSVINEDFDKYEAQKPLLGGQSFKQDV